MSEISLALEKLQHICSKLISVPKINATLCNVVKLYTGFLHIYALPLHVTCCALYCAYGSK